MKNETERSHIQQLPTEQSLWQMLLASKQANISGGTVNQASTNLELLVPADTVERPSGSTFVRIPVKIDHDI